MHSFLQQQQQQQLQKQQAHICIMLPADHIHNNDVFRSVRKKNEKQTCSTDSSVRWKLVESVGGRTVFPVAAGSSVPPSYLFFELIWLYGNFLNKIYSFLQIWCISGLLLLLPIDLLPAQVGTNNWCGRLKTLRPEQRESAWTREST